MRLGADVVRVHIEIVVYRSTRKAKNAANRRRRAAVGLALERTWIDTDHMLTTAKTVLLLAMVLFSMGALQQNATAPSSSPEYTSDSQLKFPEHYRDWEYLTSGFDMSYNPAMQMGDHHTFDNVFVNPEAYKVFVKTGTWPDKTMLVLEVRGAEGKGSIQPERQLPGRCHGIRGTRKRRSAVSRQVGLLWL